MPESKSVQVEGRAHAKVLAVADVLGSTQLRAASLLIEVASEQDAVKRHHREVDDRLNRRLATTGAAGAAAGAAGRDQQGGRRPGPATPATSRPPGPASAK